MQKDINGITMEMIQGNIAAQPDVEAVVNAANAHLRMGGGVAGAIHRVAGPKLEEETRPLAPISPGEAVLTKGYNLPNKYVIHVLGPVYGKDKPEAKLLADCYENALKLAEGHKIKRLAFPAISTGAFGYPMRDAANIAFKTVLKMTAKLENFELIRFVLFSEHDLEVHKVVFQQLLADM